MPKSRVKTPTAIRTLVTALNQFAREVSRDIATVNGEIQRLSREVNRFGHLKAQKHARKRAHKKSYPKEARPTKHVRVPTPEPQPPSNEPMFTPGPKIVPEVPLGDIFGQESNSPVKGNN